MKLGISMKSYRPIMSIIRIIHDWLTVSKLKRYILIQTSNTTTRFQWPLWFGLEGILFLQNWFDDLHGNELWGTKFITNFFQSFVSHDIVGFIWLTRIVCFYISLITFDYCNYFNINTTLEILLYIFSYYKTWKCWNWGIVQI